MAGHAEADAFDNAWCGIDAGDLRLVTDAGESEARLMVRTLQSFRPVASRYLPGVANPADPPLTVMVFDGRRDFRRAIGTSVVGFLVPSLDENLMVVGPDPNAFAPQESLLHEYVHYLLRTRLEVNLPSWYDEGLSGMLSSASLDGERVVIGELPAERLSSGIEESRLTLADVLEAEDVWDWRRERIRGFYDWSRLLVHRLALGHLDGRDDWRVGLERFLADQAPSLPDALGLSARSMERELTRYLRSPVTVTHGTGAPPESALPYRCLDASETVEQVSLAVLHHNPRDAARRIEAQLDEDPQNPRLWRTLSLAREAADEPEAALAAARRARALAPRDPATAVRLAGALAMGCITRASEACRARWGEAVPLLRGALARDPQRQDAIFLLGLAYLYSGRAGDALNYLRIAHRRQPWAAHINFYLGESYRLIGDSRARAHLERARRWSPTGLWRTLAEAGLAELQPDP